MPSLIPGFEYDIFISYRHKDNKGGRWVTEFVDALRVELEATFKDDVSIYFDENPHDGLLETHNVDKSLKSKLKCLIFIPIISQTYCDPKSFAWEHELCAFNRLTKEDKFGRYIKLSDGNVGSRILPVKIHNLDAEDQKLLENELAGALRAIEFIFKAPGVNRPLTSSDKKEENSAKTFYRDQVNKVANAIKEIIGSLKNPASQPGAVNKGIESSPLLSRTTIGRKKIFLTSAVTIALAIVIYFLYWRTVSAIEEKDMPGKSIAVLPFVDLSAAKDQEYFSDGLSEELLNLLSKIPELKVIGRTSSFSFKGKNEDLRIIGNKLGVTHILEGSVQKEGKKIRVTAQLIRASDGFHIWSEKYDRNLEGIFKLEDDIAGAVVKQLRLKLLAATVSIASSSTPTEVYNLILQGNYFVEKGNKENLAKAQTFYLKALALDSLNARSWAALGRCYVIQSDLAWANRNSNLNKARLAVNKSLALDDSYAMGHRLLGQIMTLDFDWEGAEAELQKALTLEPGDADAMRGLGALYRSIGRFDEAIKVAKQSITVDPVKAQTYLSLGQMLYFTNRLDEALESYRKILELNPNFPLTHILIGEIYLAKGNSEMALAEIRKEDLSVHKDFGVALAYHAMRQKKEADEALMNFIVNYQNEWPYRIAEIYAFRGETSKAFEWLEKAYQIKDVWLLRVKNDPLLKKIDGDLRYATFLTKMKLPL